MVVHDFKKKVLIIVSSTAQIELFKPVVEELYDFEIKFVNTEIWFFINEMESLLKKYGFNFCNIDNLNMRSVHKILDQENPDIIVTGHDQILMDILFIKATNLKGIPSLTVQDGVLVADRTIYEQNISFFDKIKYILKIPARTLNFLFVFDRSYPLKFKICLMIFELKYKKDYSLVYGHGESSKLALFGEDIKNRLIKEGVPLRKLEVTGSPKFDTLVKLKNYSKEMLKKRWGIPLNKKVVLVLTQWFVEDGSWSTNQRKLFISEIAKSISILNNNVMLIIKLHPPYERKEDYYDILKDFAVLSLIFDLEPVHEIISISDVVVSVSSTAALEAMALEKPVLIINLFNQEDAYIFKGSGALYVENRDHILPLLKKLIYCPDEIVNKSKIENFIYEQSYTLDGNASKRIADLIRKMVI